MPPSSIPRRQSHPACTVGDVKKGSVRKVQVKTNIAIIDLFAGAGGFGVASELAGASLRLSVEIDPVACITLKENAGLPHRILEADLTECIGEDLRREANLTDPDPLVVVGGAPCQPFSKAAYWVEEGKDAAWRRDRSDGIDRERPPSPTEARPDSRRTLIDHFSRLVIETKADGFVFENVPAIQHPRNQPILNRLITDAESNGYSTALVKAIASDFGVAQHRERVFVLGSRSGQPLSPLPTHDGRGLGREGMLPAVTSGEVCAPFSGDEFFEPEEVVSGRWANHLADVPPGSNYKFHTAWGGHPNPTFVTERHFGTSF